MRQKVPAYHHYLILFLFLHFALAGFAQPVITNVSPNTATIGSTITITGTGFNTNPGSTIVYFGTVKGLVTNVTATSITTVVPTGATHSRITVNTNNFTIHSPRIFNIVSGQPLDANSFASKTDFNAGLYPAFLARCDLDGDGKPDMAVTNFNSDFITVYKNNSSPGTVMFTVVNNFATGPKPEGIMFDDINTDGLPDMVVTSIDAHMFSVFINTTSAGSISFAPRVDIAYGGLYWPRGIYTADIDGDGKTDVIAADNNKIIDASGSHGTVSIHLNRSTTTNVAFAPPVFINTGDYTRGLFITDMNNDGKVDISVSNNPSGTISTYRNRSTPGIIDFSFDHATIGPTPTEQLCFGDFDGDGFSDMVLTASGIAFVSRNNGVNGGVIVFIGSSANLNPAVPLGLSVADVTGDGKPDIAVTDYVSNTISVYVNTTAGNNISFAPKMEYTTGSGLVDVKIGDVDGDNFPDLTVSNSTTNMVSILRMNIAPVTLNIGADTTICDGDSLVLRADTPGAVYTWSTGARTSSITVKQPGKYWVDVSTALHFLSDTINIAVKPAPVVSLGNDTLFCKGAANTLNVFNAGASYSWNTGASSSAIKVTKAGEYSVTVNLDGCIRKDTVVIAHDSIPQFTLGPDLVMCDNQNLLLDPGITGAGIRWQDGSTNPVFQVTGPGNYNVTISNACGSTRDDITVAPGTCNLFVPRAFTPNNDGLNDIMKPLFYGQLSSFRFEIFDRWGNKLFTSTDPRKGWDGRLKGVALSTAVFTWQCTYQFVGDKPNYQKGVFTLIR
jgi:gliding motility-associated-like protein